MFRVTKSQDVYGTTKQYIEAACESTDDKRTVDVITGSICVETDTGDVYLFSEENEDWVKQFSFQE